MHRLKPLAVFLSLLFLVFPQLSAQEEVLVSVGIAPENHIWDRDDLYRNDPAALQEVSGFLTDLKKETGLEVYLVTYSSVIGEKLEPMAMRCQEAWLGERNDGLVIALSFNNGISGAVGRSTKLYRNHFIDEDLMPRVGFIKLELIMQSAIAKLMAEEDPLDRVRVFTEECTTLLKERLELTTEADKDVESYGFMGWMAVALIVCAICVALLSKVLGSTDRRTGEVYRFPDFTVPQRLKASNGGGKLSVLDFGSPPSSDGQ